MVYSGRIGERKVCDWEQILSVFYNQSTVIINQELSLWKYLSNATPCSIIIAWWKGKFSDKGYPWNIATDFQMV